MILSRYWLRKFGATALMLGCLQPAAFASDAIEPIPQSLNADPDMAALGAKLFFDTRLSRDGSISCASCHELTTKFGTDLTPVSIGVGGQRGNRNSPTVFNAALNFTQFWDGRAEDLAAQAIEPVINPVEMGMRSWDDVEDRLDGDSEYQSLSQSIFGGKLNARNIQLAIAEYQKTLLTPNSPMDRYLNGDRTALSEQELRGYQLFQSYGCVSCHQGRNVGGNLFQKFGVLKDINLSRSSLNQDLGRYEVTGNEWDKRVFKVPSLRLAARTPPYFHDGSIATLEEAVNIMIEFQLGRTVPEADQQAIIAFLNALVGEIPEGVHP